MKHVPPQQNEVRDESCRATTGQWNVNNVTQVFPEAWHVLRITSSKEGKRILLAGQRDSRKEILLSRFCYLYDRLDTNEAPSLSNRDFFTLVEKDSCTSISKICTDGSGGLATALVTPYFERTFSLSVGSSVRLDVRCSEVTQGTDFDAVRWLNCFHYRSLNMWGRSTAIVMRLEDTSELRPYGNAIGYIILNSPPLLTRPRDEVMAWNAEGRLNNVDRVARIARVVVHPEFRGIGAGRILVQAAIAYANDHWNAAGKKPWLLETVAEMSRFHPVFEAGGMKFCGETLGRDEVLVTPAERLDHVMGPGHWRSSLDRMKMKASTPKPYFAVALNACPTSIADRVNSASGARPPLSNGVTLERLHAPLIRFEHASISFDRGEAELAPKRIASLLGFDIDESKRSVGEGLDAFAQAMSGDPVATSECADHNSCLKSDVINFSSSLKEIAHDVRCHEQKAGRASQAIATLVDIAASKRLTLVRQLDSQRQELDIEISGYFDQGQGDPQKLSKLSGARTQVENLLARLRNSTASSREVEIMTAFGLDEINSEQVVLENFCLDILPGQVVLLEGASGCGKTSVLESLLGAVSLTSGRLYPDTIEGSVAAIDLNFSPETAVIDLLGCCTREACRYLNAAGISESKVYVKRRHQLSHGQRYRVAAAVLAASGKPIWLADEFCAFLDPLTSALVANGISKLARDVGATLIVASADGNRIRKALRPDFTVRLVSGGRPSPDPQVRFWKNHDFRSIAAEWLHGRSPTDISVNQALWEHDLIFHRLATERLLSPNADENHIAAKLVEDLKPIAHQWTEIALKRQVGYRIEAFREVGTHTSVPVKGTKKPAPTRRSIKSRH